MAGLVSRVAGGGGAGACLPGARVGLPYKLYGRGGPGPHAVLFSSRCAGAGHNGRLGINSTTGSLIPAAVRAPAGVTSWVQVSLGYDHTCALDATGSAWCWGAYSREGDVLGDAGARGTSGEPRGGR